GAATPSATAIIAGVTVVVRAMTAPFPSGLVVRVGGLLRRPLGGRPLRLRLGHTAARREQAGNLLVRGRDDRAVYVDEPCHQTAAAEIFAKALRSAMPQP